MINVIDVIFCDSPKSLLVYSLRPGNFRHEYHSETSPRHALDESDQEMETSSRYIQFDAYNIFKETDI